MVRTIRRLTPPARLWPRRLAYLALMLLPLALVLARYVLLHLADRQSLSEAIAEADRLDPGWRWEELEAARKVVPDGQNSGRVAVQVMGLFPGVWPDPERARVLEGLTPERQLHLVQVEYVRREMARAHRALGPARRLADLPEGRLPISWSADGMYPILGYTHNMRTVANLLSYDAMLQAHDHDLDGALASCRGIVNANRAIGDEPTFMSMLVRHALRAVVVSSIERTLAQGEPTEPALLALQRLLEDEERQPLALIGLRGERAQWDRTLQRLQEGKASFVIALFGRPRSKGITHLPNDDEMAVLSSGSLAAQRANLLRFLTEQVEIAKLPDDQQDEAFDRLEKSLANQAVMPGVLLPFLGRNVTTQRRVQAQLRCTIVALAVERYRRQHGRWPETLPELAPAYLEKVPADLFGGRPLRYGRGKGRVVVYSVGPDGVDNSGQWDRSKPFANGTDLGFVLWDVDQRRQPPVPPKPR
jgi:hypothetical protein